MPSEGGRFELTRDGVLLYSKRATGRHTTSAEIIELLRQPPAAGAV